MHSYIVDILLDHHSDERPRYFYKYMVLKPFIDLDPNSCAIFLDRHGDEGQRNFYTGWSSQNGPLMMVVKLFLNLDGR